MYIIVNREEIDFRYKYDNSFVYKGTTIECTYYWMTAIVTLRQYCKYYDLTKCILKTANAY